LASQAEFPPSKPGGKGGPVGETHEAYCVKCRKKVVVKNHEHVTLKNNRPALRGVCTSCGSRVFRIGKT